MIDIATETVLALTEAAAVLPPLRGRKRPSYSTLWRWATKGINGVRLETVKIGGTSFTSREALQRFVAALNAEPTPAPVHVDRRPADEAQARLREKGFTPA